MRTKTHQYALWKLMASGSGPMPDLTPPDPPSALVLTPGDRQFTASWTDSPSGDVEGDEYRYKAGAGSFGSWTTDVSPVTITGLTNDTVYTFEVRAYDAVPNASSAISDTVTPVANPGARSLNQNPVYLWLLNEDSGTSAADIGVGP